MIHVPALTDTVLNSLTKTVVHGYAARTKKTMDEATAWWLPATAVLVVISSSCQCGLALDSSHPDDIASGQCPGTEPTDSRLDCLTKAYAPLLKFDSFESFFPSAVDDFLPSMKLINEDGSAIPNQPDPLSSTNLVSLTLKPLTTFLTTKVPLYESDVKYKDSPQRIAQRHSFLLGRAPTYQCTVPIYTTIVRKSPILFDFVYFTFYPFNQGKLIRNSTVWGNHVGDWEYVTLRISFENPSPKLIEAYTSQHSSGDCLTPSNLTFVSNTAHPILYVARGSHCTYNKPGRTVYQRIILFGDLADDHDGGNAAQWETWNNVVVRVEGQPLTREYTWWGFNGRWGNKQGPTSVFGQYILQNGSAYPAISAITFQLDNPALEDCPRS